MEFAFVDEEKTRADVIAVVVVGGSQDQAEAE
jgi:hypothetical protein